jgi:hypothetical protein
LILGGARGEVSEWPKSFSNWAHEDVSMMAEIALLLTMGLYCKKLLVMAKLHPKKLFLTPTLFFVFLVSIWCP